MLLHISATTLRIISSGPSEPRVLSLSTASGLPLQPTKPTPQTRGCLRHPRRSRRASSGACFDVERTIF
jgi:hypothetical protein